MLLHGTVMTLINISMVYSSHCRLYFFVISGHFDTDLDLRFQWVLYQIEGCFSTLPLDSWYLKHGYNHQNYNSICFKAELMENMNFLAAILKIQMAAPPHCVKV